MEDSESSVPFLPGFCLLFSILQLAAKSLPLSPSASLNWQPSTSPGGAVAWLENPSSDMAGSRTAGEKFGAFSNLGSKGSPSFPSGSSKTSGIGGCRAFSCEAHAYFADVLAYWCSLVTFAGSVSLTILSVLSASFFVFLSAILMAEVTNSWRSWRDFPKRSLVGGFLGVRTAS